jgi:integrase
MPRVNMLKQVKVDGHWKLVAIPRDGHGRPNWKALPEGRYFIEWREHGKRRREAAGVTTADALETARRRKHVLEGRALGLERYAANEEEAKHTPLHVAVKRYLELVEGLKKPNTLRKYKAVLNRFLDYFADRTSAHSITPDDLNQFMVHIKRRNRLDNNSVIHNMIIVAQFLKKQGRPGLTGSIELPEPVRSLPGEYSDRELEAFFEASAAEERRLFATFLLTGFREQEVVHLFWDDINFTLNTVRVTRSRTSDSRRSDGRSVKCQNRSG